MQLQLSSASCWDCVAFATGQMLVLSCTFTIANISGRPCAIEFSVLLTSDAALNTKQLSTRCWILMPFWQVLGTAHLVDLRTLSQRLGLSVREFAGHLKTSNESSNIDWKRMHDTVIIWSTAMLLQSWRLWQVYSVFRLLTPQGINMLSWVLLDPIKILIQSFSSTPFEVVRPVACTK